MKLLDKTKKLEPHEKKSEFAKRLKRAHAITHAQKIFEK